MHQILHEEPRPVGEASGGSVGTDYDGVLARALAKQADRRYATADEMRAALHDAARQARSAPLAPMDATLTHAGLRRPAAAARATPAPASWDADLLAAIERALASHVGPLSRLILREAAERCDSAADLGDALARHIPDERGRQAFLGQVRQLDADRRAATPAEAGALTATCRAAALELLTRRLGPVARVLVRRAEETASGSRARFVQDLLAQTPAAERSALQKDFDALPH
jgi:serine/threonine-protein kinase